MYKLVIVDTTAAPVLYIVGQSMFYILARCVAPGNIPIHDEDFHTYKYRKGSMHSFSSIYTALIKTFSVSRIVYSKP